MPYWNGRWPGRRHCLPFLFLAIVLTVIYLLPTELSELSQTARRGLAWHLLFCIGTYSSYSTARTVSSESRQETRLQDGWRRRLAAAFPPHSWPGLAMGASLLLHLWGDGVWHDVAGWTLFAGLCGAALTAGQHVWTLRRRQNS